MTPKQERFVQEYLIDLNATQAALRAGYRHPDVGRQLLTKKHVLEAIRKAQERREIRTEVTQDKVIKELARVAFSDPRKIFEWGPYGVRLLRSSDLTDDEAAAVGEVSQTTSENGGSLKAKLHDKLRALELLGRHIGMFTDKVQMDVNVTPAAILEEVRKRRERSGRTG